MRFTLIDRIESLVPGESIVATKNLTTSEEYLADHFPGFAVMPGVLMVETLVQAAAWLIRATDDFRDSIVVLRQTKAVKFNSFVRPGQTLKVTCSIHSRGDGETTVKASGAVGETSTVSARLVLAHFNPSDHSAKPTVIEGDNRRRELQRNQFAELTASPIGR